MGVTSRLWPTGAMLVSDRRHANCGRIICSAVMVVTLNAIEQSLVVYEHQSPHVKHKSNHIEAVHLSKKLFQVVLVVFLKSPIPSVFLPCRCKMDKMDKQMDK